MSITLIQISDCHLLKHPHDRLRGHDPYGCLKDVLTLAAQYRPDAFLFTGDLAEDGERSAYGQLALLLDPLGIPCYWLPGNHDRPEALSHQLGPRYVGVLDGIQTIKLDPWQLILLDSVDPKSQWGSGYLSSTALTQLRQTLEQTPLTPTLIALHHHPIQVGLDWLDSINLKNSSEFLTLAASFSQVKLIVFGHIHWALEMPVSPHAMAYGCPSSVFQVTTETMEPQAKQPGFRILQLEPDGSHKTWVKRLQASPIG